MQNQKSNLLKNALSLSSKKNIYLLHFPLFESQNRVVASSIDSNGQILYRQDRKIELQILVHITANVNIS